MKTSQFYKIIIAVGLSAALSGCLLVDEIGLNPSAIKGTDAANRIVHAAVIADLPWGGVSILALVADVIAGVESDAYYTRSSVEDCEKSIKGITGFILGPTIANVLKCKLVKDPTIIKIGPIGL